MFINCLEEYLSSIEDYPQSPEMDRVDELEYEKSFLLGLLLAARKALDNVGKQDRCIDYDSVREVKSKMCRH